MPGDIVEAAPGGEVPLDVGQHCSDCIGALGRWAGGTKNPAVDTGQQIGCLICGAAKHDTIDVREVRFRLIQCRDTTVDDDRQFGARLLQTVDTLIIERRHLAVFLRRQATQPGLARMNDERAAPSIGDAVDEPLEVGFAVLVVDTDAAFDGYNCLR